jgi:hypothetical protein
MTYQELWDHLQRLRRNAPHRMSDQVLFLVDGEDLPRQVRAFETNDGSLPTIPTFARFLSEV